jgi:cytidylate kinase
MLSTSSSAIRLEALSGTTLIEQNTLSGVDATDAKAIAALCADWPAALVNREGSIWLEVDGYFPEAEIRAEKTSAAVSHVATVPFVREFAIRFLGS